MSDPIAKASIEINADLDGLKKGVSDAKREVESAGDSGKKAGATIGDSFGQAGKKIEGATSGVRKFTGALSSTVGAVTGVVGAVGSLIAVLSILKTKSEENQEQQRKARREYIDLTDAVNKFTQATFKSEQQMADSFDALARRIDDSKTLTESRANDLFKQALDSFRSRGPEINKAIRDAERQAALDAERILNESIRNQARVIRGAIDELNEGLLPEEDQIAAKYERIFSKILRAIQQSNIDPLEAQGLLDQARDAVDAKKKAEMDAFDERMAREEKAEKEKAKRVADQYQRELTRAFDAASASLISAFGGEGGDFSSMVNAINNLSAQVQEAGQNGRR
jgi:hypothetical protein